MINNISSILTALGALVLVFITPIGSMTIDRLFSRRPAFSVQSPALDSDLILVIQPANSVARKKRVLGIKVRGLLISIFAKPQYEATRIQRVVDLSKVERITEILKVGEDHDFQFFFEPNRPSEVVTIRFVGKQKRKRSQSPNELTKANDSNGLLMGLHLNSRVECAFQSSMITLAFPFSSEHIE